MTDVYVPGYYDRGKTRQNHFEAKAVVAEVVKRLAEAKRSHIQSSRTSSEGVAGIKAFLQYSEKGISSLPQKQSILTGPQKTSEKMVAQVLQDRGYTVETNIGSSENTPT